MLEDSITATLESIEYWQRRWMIGDEETFAPEQVPQAFQTLIAHQAPNRQRLTLLALSSQMQTFLLEAEAPNLTTLASLPDLHRPHLPDPLRALFRRALEQIPNHFLAQLLNMLLQRGVIAHPSDWLPQGTEENLPKTYWPWSRWAMDSAQYFNDAISEQLDTHNWDTFYPAERLTLLKEMRLKQPQLARQIITECASREPADKRVKIIATLALNLSHDDVEYLKCLLQDRSRKITLLAGQLLARLNIPAVASTNSQTNIARELAETLEVKRSGLIKKHLTITPKNLKSKKQQAVRSEQLEQVAFIELAQALDLSAQQLATSWQFAEFRLHDNQQFIASATNTMPEDLLDKLTENMVGNFKETENLFSLLQPLLPRLNARQKADLLPQILKLHAVHFADCLFLTEGVTPDLDWQRLQKLPAWTGLVERLRLQLADNSYMNNSQENNELKALGLLLTQETASKTLNFLLETGLLLADPALDTLKLNTQLNPDSTLLS